MLSLSALLALALALTAAARASASGPAPPEKSQRPNIIVFLADDLGYGDIGSYGAPTIATVSRSVDERLAGNGEPEAVATADCGTPDVAPNIDDLARRGMTLRQFYSASSVCTPSRAGILTGREPLRSGMYTDVLNNTLRVFYPFSTGGLPLDAVTIPTMLRRANYSSMLVGKWHLGHVDSLPQQRGFDRFFGIPYSHDMSGEDYGVADIPVANRMVPPLPLYRNNLLIEQPVDLDTMPTRMAHEAIEFMKEQAARNTPFFLMVAFYQPHLPLVPSPAYRNTSLRGLYGDFVHELDGILGEIMQGVDSLGLANSTLVHLSSDNGPWTIGGEGGGSTGGFAGGKGTTWEGGMRVPSIFALPGVIAAGSTSFAVASALDLFRTFADFAGVEPSPLEAQDSLSLACVLRGECPKVHRRAIYYYFERNLMAVRNGAYKAHFFICNGPSCVGPPIPQHPPLLYNLEQDPFEAHPLNVSRYSKVLTELKILAELQRLEVHPSPSELDRYDLLAGPCCNPLPLARPCYGGYCQPQPARSRQHPAAKNYTVAHLQEALSVHTAVPPSPPPGPGSCQALDYAKHTKAFLRAILPLMTNTDQVSPAMSSSPSPPP